MRLGNGNMRKGKNLVSLGSGNVTLGCGEKIKTGKFWWIYKR